MSYWDQYNQGPSVFDRLVKLVAYALVAGIVGYCVYWLFFRNWREERQVRQFLEVVQDKRFEDAYEYWGCSVAAPCRHYLYEEFLDDWGVDSPLGAVQNYELGRSYTQPNGAIVEVAINGAKQPNLWVDADTRILSFFPY